jgi:hypothetical protein
MVIAMNGYTLKIMGCHRIVEGLSSAHQCDELRAVKIFDEFLTTLQEALSKSCQNVVKMSSEARRNSLFS